MARVIALLAIFGVQLAGTIFFVSDILSSYFGFSTQPLGWELREVVEIAAAAALVIGVVFGGLALWHAHRQRHAAEERLRIASSAFMDMLEERLVQWKLTPAERDVALFAIKGLSIAEIAALRQTSEGTIKAQTNAIYRKAGVTGRPQLLSLFIEDLMSNDHHSLAAPEPLPLLPSPARPAA